MPRGFCFYPLRGHIEPDVDLCGAVDKLHLPRVPANACRVLKIREIKVEHGPARPSQRRSLIR